MSTFTQRMLTPVNNLSIGIRLSLAFLGVFVLMAVMAVFASYEMFRMNERMSHITQGNNQQIARVNVMIDSVSQRAIAVRNLTLLKDPALKKEELDAIEKSAKEYTQAEVELIALIEKYDASEAEKALLESIKRSEKVGTGLLQQAIELGMANKTEEAVEFLMEKVRPRQVRWITVLQTLSGLQAKTAGEYSEDSTTRYIKARNLLIGFVLAALLAGAVLAWLVTISITRPLKVAMRVALAAAKGDLTVRVSSASRSETGMLLAALKEMNRNLAEVVSGVRDGSEGVARGTTEIASGNNELSQRTEQQAASLEETSATMQEIQSAVRNNANTAKEASAMAESASAAAAKGGAVVNEVVQTMAQITTSSKRIGDITSVIDGIAFQTNILALNAAVEAARAGEQGRGFAVVAAEVRSLAQRSADAAKEIKVLISGSVDKVREGAVVVKGAGDTMSEIVISAKRMGSLLGEISTATTEQSLGMSQVNSSVQELDRMTQQNAALVEETAAAAGSLHDQAHQLSQEVAQFRLP